MQITNTVSLSYRRICDTRREEAIYNCKHHIMQMWNGDYNPSRIVARS